MSSFPGQSLAPVSRSGLKEPTFKGLRQDSQGKKGERAEEQHLCNLGEAFQARALPLGFRGTGKESLYPSGMGTLGRWIEAWGGMGAGDSRTVVGAGGEGL